MVPNSMLPLLYKMLGHLAILVGAMGSVLAVDVDFRNQITLGSVIVTAVVVVIAGIFTIRSKIATTWREEAEGEKAAKERIQQEFSEFEKNQQEIRHDLKGKIAELSSQIKVMEAKTDLTAALDALKEIAEQQHSGHDETHKLLKEIRDKLPETPIPTKIVGDK